MGEACGLDGIRRLSGKNSSRQTKEGDMQKLIPIFILALVTTVAWSDFSCPNGGDPVCLDEGDKVCPYSTMCVNEQATCFDDYPCDPNAGFVCESEFDSVMDDARQATAEHDELTSENVDLRVQRLETKNCILNADELAGAKKCVR